MIKRFLRWLGLVDLVWLRTFSGELRLLVRYHDGEGRFYA